MMLNSLSQWLITGTSPFVRSIRDLTPGRHMLSVQAERTYGASSTRQLAETVSGFEVGESLACYMLHLKSLHMRLYMHINKQI